MKREMQMRDDRKDYVVKETWEDGSETYFISRERSDVCVYTGTGGPQDAIARAHVRWDSMAHVFGAHGTVITRPTAFEIYNATAEDMPHYWHPASSISSLVKRVYLLDEMEHYG
jgi:hypothetical protein